MRAEKLCPDGDTLIEFLSGNLQTEQVAEVERHLSRCGICDVLVERMRAFDQTADPGPEWPAVEARLESRFGIRGRPRRLLWHPILAYAMVIALIYPAYLGLRPRTTPLENVRIIELDATRSASPAAPIPQVSDDRVLLSFFFPIRDGFRYRASIVGIVGPAEAHSYDGMGHFALSYSLATIARGTYSLRLEEQDPGGKVTQTKDYQFSR